MFRFSCLLATGCLALVLSGCTTVGEVRLDDSASLAGTGKARIKTESDHKHAILGGLDRRVYIMNVDGRSLWRMGNSSDFPEAMLVDPGRHTIMVRFDHFNQYANGRLWWIAESEHEYLVRREVSGYAVRLWIEDVATHLPVGGIAP